MCVLGGGGGALNIQTVIPCMAANTVHSHRDSDTHKDSDTHTHTHTHTHTQTQAHTHTHTRLTLCMRSFVAMIRAVGRLLKRGVAINVHF